MSSLSNINSFTRSMNGLNNINANSIDTQNLDVETLVIEVSGTAPTMPALNNSLNIANTAYVDNAINTIGTNYVDLTTNQTITSGIKTFVNLPECSTSATLGDELTNKTYVDNAISTAITTAGSNYVDLTSTQTITGDKTFTGSVDFLSLSASYISNTSSIDTPSITSGLQTDDLNIAQNQTSGKLFLGCRTDRTGAINIGTLATGNAPIVVGSTSSTTQTATHNAITTFNKIPLCAGVPATGDNLTNKTYVDNAISTAGTNYVNLTGTQAISGAKTFNTNTLTASAGITVKNGGSAQICTLTQNATTFDIIGAGDISVKPTNDFNVLTGTGKNITISNPDSALLQSQTTLSTGVLNTSSYIALQSPTTYILGLSTQPSLILSGGFGTIYGLKFTRGGTALTAINRINCSNTNDTFYLEVNSGTQLTITNTAVSISTNFLINQTTYPSTDTTQLGYTIQKTFATTVLGDTTGTFTVVGTGQALGTNKGVYLITCGFELTNSGSDTVNNKAVCLSLSSGSGTPVNAYGAWEYYEEINDAMGSAGTRYIGTLTGVYTKTTTSAQTLYLNGYANTSGSQTISCTGNCSITRIG